MRTGQPQNEAWAQVTTAAMVAVKHFNERNPIVLSELGAIPASCTVQIRPTLMDSESEPAASASRYAEWRDRDNSKSGSSLRVVVGPASSQCALTVATAAGPFADPVVGFWSTESSLGDSSSFPLFSRVIPGDQACSGCTHECNAAALPTHAQTSDPTIRHAQILDEMLLKFLQEDCGYHTFGVIHADEAWGQGHRDALQMWAKDKSMTMVGAEYQYSDVPSSLDAAMEVLMEGRIRVIIGQ